MLRAERRDATLSSWLSRARRRLAAAGVPSPQTDAERLAAHILGVGWGELWGRLRDPLDASMRRRLDEACDRRGGGEPLAYITGSSVFFGHELACGPGVLVPRPETEALVAVALELVSGIVEPLVVDVGTGSAAVAIAIAAERPDAQVWASDISQDALRYAARNVEGSGTQIRLVAGDLFSGLPSSMLGAVDLVVSNPPYVPSGAELPADVRREPPEALFGGARGDALLRRLVREAPVWLAPHGSLALEIGTPQQGVKIVHDLHAFTATGSRCDQNGRPRVIWATR